MTEQWCYVTGTGSNNAIYVLTRKFAVNLPPKPLFLSVMAAAWIGSIGSAFFGGDAKPTSFYEHFQQSQNATTPARCIWKILRCSSFRKITGHGKLCHVLTNYTLSEKIWFLHSFRRRHLWKKTRLVEGQRDSTIWASDMISKPSSNFVSYLLFQHHCIIYGALYRVLYYIH